MYRYRFNENNSGGHWWLESKHFGALFKAGWTYEPPKDFLKLFGRDLDKPWLDDPKSKVPSGWRSYLYFKAASLGDAIASFEEATGFSYTEEGCPCCGEPFNISEVLGE